jgi:hypothetical protein
VGCDWRARSSFSLALTTSRINSSAKPAFTPQEIDAYAAELREQNRISEIERAYGDLIALLRREVRHPPT